MSKSKYRWLNCPFCLNGVHKSEKEVTTKDLEVWNCEDCGAMFYTLKKDNSTDAGT